jgi:hypothetical protein
MVTLHNVGDTFRADSPLFGAFIRRVHSHMDLNLFFFFLGVDRLRLTTG